MACGPDTSSEIVGWEAGARTGLHVRAGRLTMLECRFNKTTHHPKHDHRRQFARITGRTSPGALLKNWKEELPLSARGYSGPKLCPKIASIKQHTTQNHTTKRRRCNHLQVTMHNRRINKTTHCLSARRELDYQIQSIQDTQIHTF